MGLYDHVKMEYPLPESAHQDWLLQSKDTPAQFMETYRVTAEGRLIHEKVRYEEVPEQERPYFGKPEWEKGALFQLCGSIQSVPLGDEDTDYHGDLSISGSPPGNHSHIVTYRLRFTHGQLESIDKWWEGEV